MTDTDIKRRVQLNWRSGCQLLNQCSKKKKGKERERERVALFLLPRLAFLMYLSSWNKEAGFNLLIVVWNYETGVCVRERGWRGLFVFSEWLGFIEAALACGEIVTALCAYVCACVQLVFGYYKLMAVIVMILCIYNSYFWSSNLID